MRDAEREDMIIVWASRGARTGFLRRSCIPYRSICSRETSLSDVHAMMIVFRCCSLLPWASGFKAPCTIICW